MMSGDGWFLPGIRVSFSGTVNDWNPSGLASAVVVCLSCDNFLSGTITGMQSGEDGRLMFLVNVGGSTVGVSNDSASSSVGNKFLNNGNTSRTLPPLGGAMGDIYDAASGCWRQVTV